MVLKYMEVPYLDCFFFADDIVVWEEEKNFQSLLYILAEYAAKWKLEFSAKKSFVMPVNRPVNVDRKWCVGFSPVNTEEEFMKEVEIIKYLVLISIKCIIFFVHMLKSLRRKFLILE